MYRFLSSKNRLNVAITRAKKAVYIIGHTRTLQVPMFLFVLLFTHYYMYIILNSTLNNIILY